jgi:predicted nucleic acid-binding protein
MFYTCRNTPRTQAIYGRGDSATPTLAWKPLAVATCPLCPAGVACSLAAIAPPHTGAVSGRIYRYPNRRSAGITENVVRFLYFTLDMPIGMLHSPAIFKARDEMYNAKMDNRIYVDSSVVIGKYDLAESRRRNAELFWSAVRNREVIAVISDVLRRELKAETLALALQFFTELPPIEWVTLTDESDALAKQYVAARVVTENHIDDCRHIALATVLRTAGVVSTNHHDMVKRAAKYNRINTENGYPKMRIVHPECYKELLQEKLQ